MIDLQLQIRHTMKQRQGEALILDAPIKADGRKLYIESYGCAMNFADSEIVASILSETGFETTGDYHQADVIFINTCSIRENAETEGTKSTIAIWCRETPKSKINCWGFGLYGRTFKI